MNEAPTRQAVIDSIDDTVKAKIPNAIPEASLFAATIVVDSLIRKDVGIPISKIYPTIMLGQFRGEDLKTPLLEFFNYVDITLYLEKEVCSYRNDQNYELSNDGNEFDDPITMEKFTIEEIATKVYWRLSSG